MRTISVRIGDAIYQLTEIQRSGRQARVKRERLVDPPTSTPSPDAAHRRDVANSTSEESRRIPLNSLGEMLREHYVEEVRLRDRDGDGRLNRHEYGAGRDEFQRVDIDGDGLVGVDDLVREALDRSDDLRGIVTGRWAPVYNHLLQVRQPDQGTLVEAVKAGTSAIYEANLAQRIEQKEDSSVPVVSREELLAKFMSANNDLSKLHRRLQNLADRLGRFHRYTPIDAFA